MVAFVEEVVEGVLLVVRVVVLLVLLARSAPTTGNCCSPFVDSSGEEPTAKGGVAYTDTSILSERNSIVV